MADPTALPLLILDDFSRADLADVAASGWRGVSDRVMGGISEETLALTEFGGRRCLRLTGIVRLENNGGFVQMARDLAPAGTPFDAAYWRGVALVVRGNGEHYGVHLRTPACVRPWQSYRAEFLAAPEWREIRLPFEGFRPHRLEPALDPGRLRRIGLVAIGRAFAADLAVQKIGFYR